MAHLLDVKKWITGIFLGSGVVLWSWCAGLNCSESCFIYSAPIFFFIAELEDKKSEPPQSTFTLIKPQQSVSCTPLMQSQRINIPRPGLCLLVDTHTGSRGSHRVAVALLFLPWGCMLVLCSVVSLQSQQRAGDDKIHITQWTRVYLRANVETVTLMYASSCKTHSSVVSKCIVSAFLLLGTQYHLVCPVTRVPCVWDAPLGASGWG